MFVQRRIMHALFPSFQRRPLDPTHEILIRHFSNDQSFVDRLWLLLIYPYCSTEETDRLLECYFVHDSFLGSHRAKSWPQSIFDIALPLNVGHIFLQTGYQILLTSGHLNDHQLTMFRSTGTYLVGEFQPRNMTAATPCQYCRMQTPAFPTSVVKLLSDIITISQDANPQPVMWQPRITCSIQPTISIVEFSSSTTRLGFILTSSGSSFRSVLQVKLKESRHEFLRSHPKPFLWRKYSPMKPTLVSFPSRVCYSQSLGYFIVDLCNSPRSRWTKTTYRSLG